tara:strand:+ start:2926 stop:3369 length:444 start_codon:yes stop_codon:yes gene_type:complete
MKKITVLSEKDNGYPITNVKKVFLDQTTATLACARLNSNTTVDKFFWMDEIELVEKSDINDIELFRSEDEIEICFDDGDPVIAEINLKSEGDEVRFHEEGIADTIRILVVKDVRICGTDIKNLFIDEKLKERIYNEAENYRQERLEN